MNRAGLGHRYKAIIASANTALDLYNRGSANLGTLKSQTFENYSIIDMFERKPIKVRNKYTDYIDKIVAEFLANKKRLN